MTDQMTIEEIAPETDLVTVGEKEKAGSIAPMRSTGNPIMDMAMAASQRNDVDMVKQLLAIRDSEDAKAAERAFNAAYAKAQSEMPIIPKRGTGHNNIRYARIEDIIQAVMPVLERHGLSLRHKTSQDADTITVTAILAHVDGHSETDVFISSPDKSGSKNSIQAVKSTITYGRRATAENILGLASYGEDDDAFASDDTANISEWRDRISGCAENKKAFMDLRAEIVKDTRLSGPERAKIEKMFAHAVQGLTKEELES